MTHPIPLEALDDRLGFVGTAGSGKTYNAGTGVERLLASGGRVVIPDPLGVWWGLGLCADGKTPAPWREKGKLVIFGGQHGDLPLNEHAGALIGETVAGMAESAVIDLSGIGTKAAERRFMLALLTTLYRHSTNEPMHVVFDEADMWAPQTVRDKDGEANKLLGMMETVVRRGRIRGFIPWLISQRPAVLNKDVLSQVDGLIAFKLTASQDRRAIGDWVSGQADQGGWPSISASLPTLPTGTGIVWLPSRDVLMTAAFPPKVTFDSSRTPKRGERVERKELKPLDLDKLKGKLAAIESEAKANDPRALKAEVARLTRELAAAAKQPPTVSPGWPDQREECAVAQARARDLESAIDTMNDRLNAVWARFCVPIAEMQEAQNECFAVRNRLLTPPQRRVAPAPVPVQRQPVPVREPRQSEGNGAVPHGCAKPLAALAGVYPAGMTEAQWATSAGYKRTGGTWQAYRSRLRGAGLIESRGGLWFATEEGAGAVGDIELPPSPGPDLARWWAAKIHGTPKLVEALIEAWPHALSKDDLAERIGMTASGGSFQAYVSRLRSPGLIEQDGAEIRLSPEVMGA